MKQRWKDERGLKKKKKKKERKNSRMWAKFKFGDTHIEKKKLQNLGSQRIPKTSHLNWKWGEPRRSHPRRKSISESTFGDNLGEIHLRWRSSFVPAPLEKWDGLQMALILKPTNGVVVGWSSILVSKSHKANVFFQLWIRGCQWVLKGWRNGSTRVRKCSQIQI